MRHIFAANVHNIHETDKKNGIFHPYIYKESLQFRKKTIHLPILIGKVLRKTSPGTPCPMMEEYMEKLLHYVWQHRIFPIGEMRTTDGRTVEIINPGLHNMDAGPDFFNAQVRIGEEYWVGNVEIHRLSSDWYRHHHETDPAYNNVVLHVVERQDCAVTTENGHTLPQMTISVPQNIVENYAELLAEDAYPPCYRVIPQISSLEIHAWMDTLAAERLENKTERILQWLERTGGDWQRTFFITLARAFGFGTNAEAFEQWAFNVRQDQVGKHRDNPLQVEAYFMGTAGLIENLSETGENAQNKALLMRELKFMKSKFGIVPMERQIWKLGRLRPQNFPQVRISQLAALYSAERINFSDIRSMTDIGEIRKALSVKALGFCTKPYGLSEKSIDLLVINVICPTLFAYGRYSGKENLCALAIELLAQLPAEQNHVTRYWERAGVTAQHAADSQALLHLKARYCDPKDCLRCRFGPIYLQKRHRDAGNL